jgi:ubiquinone/menaquinone biosynthesis C-methylase UbiE
MSDTVERFSNRVANYVKYRPGYPPEVIELFRSELGLTPESIVADIGSGTGLSAKLFLENGNKVYCVEPNESMRAAAEEFLKDHPNFVSIDGTAEHTMLPDSEVDLIVAAQAFHWFEPEGTRNEFKRILKPGGYVVLMWNERQLDTTPFLREYEQLLLKYANDYEKVRHENVTVDVLEDFFHKPFAQKTFENIQVLNFEGLKGRLLSSSYMPWEDDPKYPAMIEELSSLFAKHAESDKIKIFYSTNVFFCQL